MWYASDGLSLESATNHPDQEASIIIAISPAGLVPETATFGPVLTATQDVSNQALTTVKTALMGSEARLARLILELNRAFQYSVDQGPTPTDPMAVAAVDELICAATEPTLRSVLP